MKRFALSPLVSLTLSLLATFTVWLTLNSWQVFSARQDFLWPLLGLAVLVGVVGGLLRAVSPRAIWSVLATALLSVCYVFFAVSAQGGAAGSPDAWSRAFEAAQESAQTYISPVPAGAVPSIAPLLIAGGAVVILLADLLISALRQVVLGGLLLLAVATIPVAVTAEAMHWWLLALVGACYVALLFGYQSVHLQRWGRGASSRVLSSVSPSGSTTGREWRFGVPATALGIGAVTLCLAVSIPALVSLPRTGVFGGSGWGSLGAGSSEGQIEVSNPVVDMRRDLTRGQDRDVLTLRTDDPSPSYLRLGTLNSFNGSAWTPGDRDVQRSANGTFPELPGVPAGLPRTRYDYEVHALPVLESDWLPVMDSTTSAQTTDDWTVDPKTLDVFHGGDDEATTSDLRYSFAAVDLKLDPAKLSISASGASEVDPQFLNLPDQMPPIVGEIAREVTQDKTSAFDRAVALQEWFRTGGGFEYSLQRAPVGSGNGTLERFLDERVGYCEQFSSAMAVMARELGIPARVAVGWLRPKETSPGTFVYSSHDAHAWTEIYLKGAGWVAFEPTPSTRASQVPEYTEQQNTPSPSASASASTSASASPSPSASSSSSGPARPSASASPTAAADKGSSDGPGVPWVPLLLGLGVILLVAALLLAPGFVRAARSRSRRASGDPELAWIELLDAANDLGLQPPRGRSLRETGGWLLEHLAAPVSNRSGAAVQTRPEHAPGVAGEVEALAHALESRRYSPSGSLHGDSWAWPEQTLVALAAGVSTRARARARWWPGSVFARR